MRLSGIGVVVCLVVACAGLGIGDEGAAGRGAVCDFSSPPPPLGDDGLADGDQPEHGDVCDSVERNGLLLAGDAACIRTLASGGTDNRMFCHPERAQCVVRCQVDDDCPRDWACDARTRTTNATGGQSICEVQACMRDGLYR
jgi:hypothetical protein